MSRISVILLLCATTALASAIPKPAEHKTSNDRVVEKDLSHKEHFEGQDHNSDYDHEAFLGEEEAKSFDDLSPEESRQRLGIIYDKIDSDKDELVTEEELVAWIKHVQGRYIQDDTGRQWGEHDVEDDTLHWEAYKKRTYGLEDHNDEDDEGYNYKEMMQRDERRWRHADVDKDGKLTKLEFSYFLHPEEADHMREIVIDETLEDIDKNKDGFIDLQEYIDDMYPSEDSEEFEPDWVKEERDDFNQERDLNKDGRLDRDEVAKWILPDEEGEYIEEEAKHLLQEADDDQDGKLSKDEVLNKYDLFVGSQATDFGEALTRHDEF